MHKIASLRKRGGRDYCAHANKRWTNHKLSICTHPGTCWILRTCVWPKAPLTFGGIAWTTLTKAETGGNILVRVWGRANWRTLPLTAILSIPEHYKHIMTRKNELQTVKASMWILAKTTKSSTWNPGTYLTSGFLQRSKQTNSNRAT